MTTLTQSTVAVLTHDSCTFLTLEMNHVSVLTYSTRVEEHLQIVPLLPQRRHTVPKIPPISTIYLSTFHTYHIKLYYNPERLSHNVRHRIHPPHLPAQWRLPLHRPGIRSRATIQEINLFVSQVSV